MQFRGFNNNMNGLQWKEKILSKSLLLAEAYY